MRLAAAHAVAERAHGDQEPGEDEAVDVDDPQQLRAAGSEIFGEERHGEAEHRHVDGDEQHGEHQHGERPALLGADAGAGLLRCAKRGGHGFHSFWT